MTDRQRAYLTRLFDAAMFTKAQQDAVLHYMGPSRLIDALRPPKGCPRSEHWRVTHSKGRRLLAAMADFASANEPNAAEALAMLRADDETADWRGLKPDTYVQVRGPWMEAERDVDARHDIRERRTDEQAEKDMQDLERC